MTEFETAELTFSLLGYAMTAMALYFRNQRGQRCLIGTRVK